MKRINNIIPKTTIPQLKESLLAEEPEKHLREKLDDVKRELEGLLRQRRYYDSIMLFASLIEPVNNFFDRVLVMDKREDIKMNRLALLNEIWRTVSTIADFSKLSASQ
jgi:glycyl-tRNA synthetase beta chain